jgi:WD40 repeat protein
MMLVGWISAWGPISHASVFETAAWTTKASFELKMSDWDRSVGFAAITAEVIVQPLSRKRGQDRTPIRKYGIRSGQFSGVIKQPDIEFYRYIDGPRPDRCILQGPRMSLTLWDVLKGDEIASLGQYRQPVVEFSRDGTRVAIVSTTDIGRLQLSVLETEAGKPLRQLDSIGFHPDDRFFQLCWSPDGSQLFGLFSRGIQVWSIPDGKYWQSFGGRHGFAEGHIAITPDGTELVLGGKRGEISRWQVPNTEQR